MLQRISIWRTFPPAAKTKKKLRGSSKGQRCNLFSILVLCPQDRVSDFEDGDVYMSSHEHRFRMFSSVEYEGQLYMTPQNFIESVTMSEPRSMLHSY